MSMGFSKVPSRRGRLTAGLLAALVALSLAACNGSDGSEDGTDSPTPPPPTPTGTLEIATFVSDEPPFAIDYPANWTADEGKKEGEPAIQATDTTTGESVNVALQRVTPDTTLKSYTDSAVDALAAAGLTVAEPTSGTLGGEEASIIESTSDEDPGFQLVQTFTILDGIAYVVTYAAPPGVFDAARGQSIVQSFTFDV